MTTSHTPGPWFYDFAGDAAAVIVDREGDHVVDLVASSYTTAQSALPGNARLIAAAPSLLDALRWALDQLDDDLDPDHQAALAAARATLAAATGEA